MLIAQYSLKVLQKNSKTTVLFYPRQYQYFTYLFLACVLGSSGLRVCNREVAVDFSMGKVVYMKVQDEKKGNDTEIENNDMGVAQMEGDIIDEMDGENDDEEEMEVDEENKDEDNEDGENEDGDDDGEEGDENEHEEGGDEEEEEEEEEEVNTDDVDKGCTLFIRSMSKICIPSY